MKKNKKLILLMSLSAIIILIIFTVYIFIIKPNSKLDTQFFDRNGKEIATIAYNNVSFFDNIKSYYLASAIEEILNDIKEKENISESEAKKILATGGFKIYTCEDSLVQNNLEEIYKNNENFKDTEEAATVVIDSSIGEVIGIIGGRNKDNNIISFGENTNTTNFNRATSSLKQPGNIISLFSVYAYGLDKGRFTLDSKYSDTPLKNSNLNSKNLYANFKGNITIKEAINNGSNLVMVKALQDIGIESSYQFVQDLNVSINEQDKNIPSLSLGELTKGCTVLEICSAYRTILTDGMYKEPIFYSKILDKKNKPYISNEQKLSELINSKTCENIKSCIKETINENETYTYSTSNNNTEYYWSVINTDNYTITTWYGYDDIIPLKSSQNEARKLTLKIFNTL